LFGLQKTEQLYDTNIDYIVKIYIGNAFENNKVNSINNIWFPHDNQDEDLNCIFEKY